MSEFCLSTLRWPPRTRGDRLTAADDDENIVSGLLQPRIMVVGSLSFDCTVERLPCLVVGQTKLFSHEHAARRTRAGSTNPLREYLSNEHFHPLAVRDFVALVTSSHDRDNLCTCFNTLARIYESARNRAVTAQPALSRYLLPCSHLCLVFLPIAACSMPLQQALARQLDLPASLTGFEATL
jgi:hypothetical protein